MIADYETNFVYFSEHLTLNSKYQAASDRITDLLEKHNINYGFLNGTKDIWCRDYLPIQTAVDNFVQFRYEPSYLKNDLDLQSNPNSVLNLNGIRATYSNINLDGGNVIKWGDRVILTDRIYRENAQLNPVDLINDLENYFSSEVLVIPNINSDITGHVDGHIRFIDEKTLLVNELKHEYKYWQKGFLKMANQAGLDFYEINWFEHDDKKYPYSAMGIYVNYLEVGNIILFPIFELDAIEDAKAVATIRSIFPDRIIEPININEIANEGGLLNCISWTIKTTL